MAHVPVLLNEVIKYLDVRPNLNYIDATFGEGGYAKEILLASTPNGKVLGVDWNEEAISYLKKEFEIVNNPKYPAPKNGGGSEAGSTSSLEEPQPLRSGPRPALVKELNSGRLVLTNGNFSQIKNLALKNSFNRVGGIVFDLGLSTGLITSSGRGFSYLTDEPLLMTFSKEQATQGGKTARTVLNALSEKDLEKLFRTYGEIRQARQIAQSIVEYRKKRLIRTTKELRDTVEQAVKSATPKLLAQVWQALRIEVNNELENLKSGLKGAWSLLNKNSPLVVVSFHSLEDRIVKEFFRGKYQEGVGEILTKKPITPSREEVSINKKSRSAKLRAIRKI